MAAPLATLPHVSLTCVCVYLCVLLLALFPFCLVPFLSSPALALFSHVYNAVLIFVARSLPFPPPPPYFPVPFLPNHPPTQLPIHPSVLLYAFHLDLLELFPFLSTWSLLYLPAAEAASYM